MHNRETLSLDRHVCIHTYDAALVILMKPCAGCLQMVEYLAVFGVQSTKRLDITTGELDNLKPMVVCDSHFIDLTPSRSSLHRS